MNTQKAFELSHSLLEKNIECFSHTDIEILEELIVYHGDLYYKKESPIISDSEYDILFTKLQELKESSWKDISLQDKTGDIFSQSSFEKVAHSRPMISLDNTYNEQELSDFDTRIKRILHSDDTLPYTLEYKFDGLGIELVYIDGVLTQAITRWNGQVWEDVTENIKQIKNIPQNISHRWRFEIRGEVVMPLSSFERLNEQAKQAGEKIFSNPRNAASWSLRVLDTSITKKRDLKFFAYDVSDFEVFEGRYSDMIHYLASLGFEISSYFPQCDGIEAVISSIENIENLRQEIDFEVDGLVVKVDDISLWKEIWFTEHHPRYAIAYKFPAEIVTTEILSVEHSLWRTGTLTPVANLAPVNIGGAIIRRATLHNYDEVEKLEVYIGDMVFLKRAGEVIPKIISVSVHSGKEQILPPEYCPSCGTSIKKDQDKVRYYCPNNDTCPAQMREKLSYAVWKQGFDIDWFGQKQAELFYSLWYITTLGDIFRLKQYREDILELEWFQEKSVNTLLESIEKVREMDIVTFLRALGIPGVGKKGAKILSQLFDNKDSLNYESLPDQETLENLNDIWPEGAKSVRDFFEKHTLIIRDLLEELELSFPKAKSNTWKYAWKRMCITGSFDGYTRDQLIELLEQEWGNFVSSVSSKTDYLLAGEKAGGKLKKAQDLGVEILNLEEFLK